MSEVSVYTAAGLAIFVIGFLGVVIRRGVAEKLIALNIAGSGIFIFLAGTAAGGEGGPDPVPHALILTGVVVTVSVTALALAIYNRLGGDNREENPGDPRSQQQDL